MCLLDFLKSHAPIKLNNHLYTKYTKSTATTNTALTSESSIGKSLNLKQSSYYPEFMLLKNDDAETLSTSLLEEEEDGSSCTDFIYASGKCENFHCITTDFNDVEEK